MNDKDMYNLGVRDGMAYVLAMTSKKVKLPMIAEEYEKAYGEHFSLKWHKEVA